MTTDLDSLVIDLKLVKWRNDEFAATTEQLENSFPQLVQEITKLVEEMPSYKIPFGHMSVKKTTDKLLEKWAELELQKAKTRAETTFKDVINTLPNETTTYDHIKSGFYIAAAPALTVASFALIPALVAFATTSVTSFFVISTASISIPTVVIGTGGILTANLLGWKASAKVTNRSRQKLAVRMICYARAAVFGFGLNADAPYLLNNMQAMILRSGQQELNELP